MRSALDTIRRVPRVIMASAYLFVGFLLWSALFSSPLDLDDIMNDNRALLSFPAGLDDTIQNDQEGSLRRTLLSDGILLADGNSTCPDTNENVVVNDRKVNIVMMSYSPHRLDDVAWLLRCYGKMTGAVEKIIFVWNNLKVDLPEGIIPPTDTENVVPVQLFNPTKNLMTNRFDAPSRFVDSFSPVLIVDDNVFLTAGLISGMVDYWKGMACRQKCVVGLDPRYVNPYTQKYELYKSIREGSGSSNVAIGKTLLTSNLNIRRFMSNRMLVKRSGPPSNACEDLSFSLFVTRKLRLLPVFVNADHYTPDTQVNSQQKYLSEEGQFIGSRYGISDFDGRSWVKGNWFRRRHKCVVYNFAYHGKVLRNILKNAEKSS
mmetsp:Transcript_30996/g.64829  ORF Transcript_30996/g.64829 Transcript_30996/m.64829 type:complete len:374 (+) Transcript_30996:96-1217(+)